MHQTKIIEINQRRNKELASFAVSNVSPFEAQSTPDIAQTKAQQKYMYNK